MSMRMIWTSFAGGVCISVLACGFEDPVPQQPAFPTNTSGTTSVVPAAGTGGAFATGGDTGSGGAFGNAGAFVTGGMDAGGTPGAAGTPAGGSGGAGTAGTPTAGTGGGGGAPAVCPMPGNAESPLPLSVSDNFAPSGYFAGPMANIAGIVAAACESRPVEHTVGACSKYTFQATMLEGTGAYGGVFWQYGPNNWGIAPGMKVAAGATKVTFKAWGAVGGEVVTFSAGGITGLCADGVNLGQGGGTTQTLTTTPTAYTVDLLGQTYPNGIIGGFVWSTAVTTLDQVVSFYVDEIQWVQ